MSFQPADIKKPRAYQRPHVEVPENFNLLDDVDWSQRIVVEVGCGTGRWSLAEAEKNPGVQHIAIERTHEKFSKLKRASEEKKLTNLYVVQADAIFLMHEKFPDSSVDLMTFFYPNPYPKKSQSNQRFFSSSSFHVILQKLRGELVFASNIQGLVQETQDFLNEFSDLKVGGIAEITLTDEPRTLFEKKYLERGETIFELRAKVS